MFLKGANKNQPELRAPSLKGVLRYWWRAFNGDLKLEELIAQENAIFGSAGESGRSNFRLIMEATNLSTRKEYPLPHKPKFNLPCIQSNSTFLIKTKLRKEVKIGSSVIFNDQKLEALLLLVSALGGLGQRSRRGMGCFAIYDPSRNLLTPNDLNSLIEKLSLLNEKIKIREDRIITQFNNTSVPYPYLRTIDIGKPEDGRRLLGRVSQLTSDLNAKYGRDYEASMGGVRSGRFASPVIFSTLPIHESNLLIPIISRVNTVSQNSRRGGSLAIQDDFVSNIINE